LLAAAQQPVPKEPAPQAPVPGQRLYLAYCAACHGKEGKGNGPAAAALRARPTDLTTLAARNGGEFPALEVSQIIGSETERIPHGSKEMPVWGPIFLVEQSSDAAEVERRIQELTRYVQSLQSDLEASRPAGRRSPRGGS